MGPPGSVILSLKEELETLTTFMLGTCPLCLVQLSTWSCCPDVRDERTLIPSKAPSLAPLILLLCPTQWPLMPLCGNVCYDGWGRLTPTGRMLNCRMGTKWTMATGYSTPSFALRHQQSRPATAAPDEFRVINNFQRWRFPCTRCTSASNGFGFRHY